MIQCRSHGITNRTLTGVFRMIPAEAWMRSLGTTRWTPLETRRLMVPRPPTMAWISSVHTPVALTTCCARICSSVPDSRSTARTPATRAPSRRNPVTWTREATCAPYCAAVRSEEHTSELQSRRDLVCRLLLEKKKKKKKTGQTEKKKKNRKKKKT